MENRYNKNRKVNIKTCSQKCGKFLLNNIQNTEILRYIVMYNNRSERRRNENKILIKSTGKC